MIKMDGLYIYEEVQLKNMWDLGNFASKGCKTGVEDGSKVSNITS